MGPKPNRPRNLLSSETCPLPLFFFHTPWQGGEGVLKIVIWEISSPAWTWMVLWYWKVLNGIVCLGESCMVLFGHFWACIHLCFLFNLEWFWVWVVFYSPLWSGMVLYSPVCLCMVRCGLLSLYIIVMGLHGLLLSRMSCKVFFRSCKPFLSPGWSWFCLIRSFVVLLGPISSWTVLFGLEHVWSCVVLYGPI